MAGGKGGGANLDASAGGAGGSGYSGQPGKAGTLDSKGAGGGGGGGGAGGGSGGTGKGNIFPGGDGGTATHKDGYDGVAGGVGQGGSGGGGGANGYLGSGAALSQSGASFVGGNGGTGGAAGSALQNGNTIISAPGGGGGGAGGFGAVAKGTQVTNSSALRGGAGGAGGAAGSGGNATNGYGGDGGVGLYASAQGVAVTNTIAGNVKGGAGGASGSINFGGSGGAGIALKAAGSVTNLGVASGGIGGQYGQGGDGIRFLSSGSTLQNDAAGRITGGAGSNSTSGGVGVNFLGSGSILINSLGTITGGVGGAGPGGGGHGGTAVSASGSTLTNKISGTITGGAGGAGGSKVGGIGGVGVAISGGTLTNYGTIGGGTGGAANSASTGGQGGFGAYARAGATITNKAGGTISGGAGGAGGSAAGGSGGTGVVMSSGTLTNDGTIKGGAYGTGLVNGSGGLGVSLSNSTLLNTGTVSGAYGGFMGVGAAGVSGAGMTIVNTGTISGTNAADAITFTGGSNTLALDSNASFNGALDVQSGTLTFDQSAGAAAGVSADATLSTKIIGAGAIIKAGSGTLTLSGANTFSGGTTISAGTLAVASDGNLGASSGGVALGGNGTLETTASFATQRNVALSGGNGVVQTDSGVATTLSGTISGSGTFAKTGAGTLSLSGTNTYIGGTKINAGNLIVSSDGNLGAASGGLTFGGGTLETTTDGFTSGRAINLTSATDTVQVDNGTTTLSGTIAGTGFSQFNKTGAGTLVLSGANTYGPTVLRAGTLSVAADGNLGRSSANLFFAGGTLETSATLSSGRNIFLNDADGRVQVDDGTTTTLSGVISGSQALTKTGAGTLSLTGANTYSGGTTIKAGTLELDLNQSGKAGTVGSGAISFQAASGYTATLTLDHALQPTSGGMFNYTLDRFSLSDTLDLKGFSYSASTKVIYDSGNLYVSNDADTETFAMTNATAGDVYYASDDGSGGTRIDVTLQNSGGQYNGPCYASRTLIRTLRGDVAVEHLAAGDLAVTSSGAHRPIKWLGHRTVDCRDHSRPHEIMPVRISAHAFGANRPQRDLFVSPGHSICVDVVGEVLIPAIALVNGATIAQLEVDEVTYWHVELDSHDVILAENLPAESYLDMGNRTFFAENDVVILDPACDASPDASTDADPALRTHADYCRPFHLHGPLVEAVRAQMRARALALGWGLSTVLDAHLEVDGRRVDPVVRDGAMRFLVPAGATDVWLVSPAVRPCDINGSIDARPLGIDLRALQVYDGFAPPREIRIDDPRLDAGFSHIEDGHRWTAGRARLPAELWADCPDAFFLRVDLCGPPVARWVVAPTDASAARHAA